MMRLLIIAAAVLAGGCAGASDEPELAPAGGIVTLNGEPVADASVTFSPEGAPSAVGKTDAQGRFSLKTGTQDGAVVGTHQVAIYAVEGGGIDLPENLPDPESDPEAYALAVEEAATAGSATPIKWVVPRKYGRTQTSGLSYEVKAGEENQFEVQLSD